MADGNGAQSRVQQDEIIKRLGEEYGGPGNIAFARTPKGLIAVRKPTAGEHQRMQEKVNDPKKSKPGAVKEYVFGAIVHPDADIATAIFQTYPALIDSLGLAMQNMAGGDLEVETGKSETSG